MDIIKRCLFRFMSTYFLKMSKIGRKRKTYLNIMFLTNMWYNVINKIIFRKIFYLNIHSILYLNYVHVYQIMGQGIKQEALISVKFLFDPKNIICNFHQITACQVQIFNKKSECGHFRNPTLADIYIFLCSLKLYD